MVAVLILLNSDDWGGSLPLSIAVHHSLGDVAELVETGHSAEALNAMDKMESRNAPAWDELHYLKGLCLQSLGNFSESRKEYTFVIEHSEDPDLILRAELGKVWLALGLRQIPRKMIRFPSTQPSAQNAI